MRVFYGSLGHKNVHNALRFNFPWLLSMLLNDPSPLTTVFVRDPCDNGYHVLLRSQSAIGISNGALDINNTLGLILGREIPGQIPIWKAHNEDDCARTE